MADEPLPLGTIPPETQQRAAEAEEIRAIEERAAQFDRHELVVPAQMHADRARLLVLLREALLREATARADLRAALRSAGTLAADVEDAMRRHLAAAPPPGPRVTVDRSRPIEEGIRLTIEAPSGTLTSLDDACDGSDR